VEGASGPGGLHPVLRRLPRPRQHRQQPRSQRTSRRGTARSR
jgi:hypothetical protein